MKIGLIKKEYKDSIDKIYNDFITGKDLRENYQSNEKVELPDSLENKNLSIYFGKYKSNKIERNEYKDFIKYLINDFMNLDKENLFDERLWHSIILLEKGKEIKEKYKNYIIDQKKFENIIFKSWGWENYVYKSLLFAHFISKNIKDDYDKQDMYIDLILNNMDIVNYIIKYQIFKNSDFLFKVLDIIKEENISDKMKNKINTAKKDERYGRKIIYELNKAYPSIMVPSLKKELLKEQILSALSKYEVLPDDKEDIVNEEED